MAGRPVLVAKGRSARRQPNLEEPESFNRLVADFLATVEAGRWSLRDPRSRSQTLTGW